MERDPRTDPMPGDEMMTGDISGRFTVVYRGPTRVTWKTPSGNEYGENLSWFRDTFKSATVIRKAEDHG